MNNETKKKRIVWVTPDDFLDTDFNPGLFRLLLKKYEIKWIVIFPRQNARFKEKDFAEMSTWEGFDIQFMYNSYRQRDPRRLVFYRALRRKINATPFDLLYFNYGPSSPYVLPLFWSLPKHRTIFSIHEGNINDNFKMPLISKILLNVTYSFAKFVHMYSQPSATAFQKKFPRAKIFTISMPLKSFGESNVARPASPIIFLSFGIVSFAKNVDMLIDAACNLYERGFHNFRVSINGACDNWEFYRSRMRYPQIFKNDIRVIENTEIPNLFNSSHYLVQPYRSTSQSGVMKIAMNYNLPIIASDLPGLKNEISEGENGYTFQTGNLEKLEDLLIKVINEHKQLYPVLLDRMRQYTSAKYGNGALSHQFEDMVSYVMADAK